MTERLADWLIGWLMKWMIGCFINQSVNWLVSQSVENLLFCFNKGFTLKTSVFQSFLNWSILFIYSVDSLFNWYTATIIFWVTDRHPGHPLTNRLTSLDWLTLWVTDWLTDSPPSWLMAIRKFSDSLIDPLTDSTMKMHHFFITINISISIVKAVLLFSSKLHNCYKLKNCLTVKKRQNDPSQSKWLDGLDSLNYTGFSWKFPVEGKNWENSNWRAHWNVHFSTCTCTMYILNNLENIKCIIFSTICLPSHRMKQFIMTL